MGETPAKASETKRKDAKSKRRGPIAVILQYFREVVAELKKVVTPTRKELIRYTIVVLSFVVVMMVIVTIADFVFGKLAAFVFAGSPLWPLW